LLPYKGTTYPRMIVKVKVKDKIHPITDHKSPEEE
jgi:hypothetical protein